MKFSAVPNLQVSVKGAQSPFPNDCSLRLAPTQSRNDRTPIIKQPPSISWTNICAFQPNMTIPIGQRPCSVYQKEKQRIQWSKGKGVMKGWCEWISGAGFLLLSGMGTGSFGRLRNFLVMMGFTSMESTARMEQVKLSNCHLKAARVHSRIVSPRATPPELLHDRRPVHAWPGSDADDFWGACARETLKADPSTHPPHKRQPPCSFPLQLWLLRSDSLETRHFPLPPLSNQEATEQ